MINITTEGNVIKNGLNIKIGYFSPIKEWTSKVVYTKGEDGLVESVFYNETPKYILEDQRPWVAFIFRFYRFYIYYRIRSWTSNIFQIGFYPKTLS